MPTLPPATDDDRRLPLVKLGEAFATNKTIRCLRLGGNKLGLNDHHYGKAFFQRLASNTALRELHADYCGISHDGCSVVGPALTATLAVLNLSGSGIGDDGAKILAGFLKGNSSLCSLQYVDETDPITIDGFPLGSVQANPSYDGLFPPSHTLL